MPLKNSEIAKLFRRIKKLGLLTNSKTHDKVYQKLIDSPNEFGGAKFIATTGEPAGVYECRECRRNLPAGKFRYYQTRVDKDGALWRSNALCSDCSKRLDSERAAVMKARKENIPPKPKSGDACPNCKRRAPGAWHRDHDYETSEFRGWICGNCNMAKQDKRNPKQK